MDDGFLQKARNFAQPLLEGSAFESGEDVLVHADAMVSMLAEMGDSQEMQAACYLVYACDHLAKPEDVIGKAFGASLAALAMETSRLIRIQRQARLSATEDVQAELGVENVRKMLLAFSRDLRVVMLRLASRLQTLRHYAMVKKPLPSGLAQESLQVFAPLANRLGIWQMKWELEDLSFRFTEPEAYRQVAQWLDEKRAERESYIAATCASIAQGLKGQGIDAKVYGRPKHIYSIVKKMRDKGVGFDRILDIRAFRILVDTVPNCYAALSWVHSHYVPMVEEFNDYIARPKSNGYQSLHTVVRDVKQKAIEIQIRTQGMHDHAEHGVAAHWAYKEAGKKGYSGVSAAGAYDAKIAVLRQLLAWEREMASANAQSRSNPSPSKKEETVAPDRIYVLTPEAAVVELPEGATPIDFAYTLHTNLGHRCRGAHVDGAMVPLNTVLKNGQTVSITALKEGGPSRDWLNPELGFLVSPRARSKVRAWFNAQVLQETVSKGREAVEKLLQREGKSSTNLEELSGHLGFKSSEALFESVGKEEFSLRAIEQFLRPHVATNVTPDDYILLKKSKPTKPSENGGVLVVGIDSLMTQLAKCCKPAPPDEIKGFVTRGKGVSIHREDCSNFAQIERKNPDRVIEVAWGHANITQPLAYQVDVSIEAFDRQGLLRDISEVFAKEKMNVVGVQTQSIKEVAWMTFTVEVIDTRKLNKVLGLIGEVKGVRNARRR
jgi:GTP pyrophosphokinase